MSISTFVMRHRNGPPTNNMVSEDEDRLEELTIKYLNGEIDIDTYNRLTEEIEESWFDLRKIAESLIRKRK